MSFWGEGDGIFSEDTYNEDSCSGPFDLPDNGERIDTDSMSIYETGEPEGAYAAIIEQDRENKVQASENVGCMSVISIMLLGVIAVTMLL